MGRKPAERFIYCRISKFGVGSCGESPKRKFLEYGWGAVLARRAS